MEPPAKPTGLLAHALRYLFGHGAARGAVYLYSLCLSWVLSKEGFVSFTLFLVGANLFARVASYSLNMLLVKVRYAAVADPPALQRQLYGFLVALSVGVTLVASGLNWAGWLHPWLGLDRTLTQLALVSGLLLAVENALLEIYQSRYESTRYVNYMACFAGCVGVASGAWYLTRGFTSVWEPALAYTLAQGLALVLFRAWPSSFRLSLGEACRFLKQGTPLFFYSVTTYLLRYIELFVMKRSLEPSVLADFTFALRLTDMLALLSVAVGGVLGPLLFHTLKAGTVEVGDRRRLRYGVGGQGALFIGFLGAAWLLVRPLFPQYGGSVPFLPWLTVLAFVNLVTSLLQVFMLHYDRNLAMLWVNLSALALTWGANLWALPRWGVTASVAIKVAVAVGIAGAYYSCVRRERVPWGALGLGRVLVPLGVILTAFACWAGL